MAKRWYYKDADGNKVPVPQYKINADNYYTKAMSDSRYYDKSATDTLLDKKVSKTDIVQSTGTSTTSVMSQKASTTAFAANTPSGDPMHNMYVAIGAVWNEETGFWAMNGLTDLTNEDMTWIYKMSYVKPLPVHRIDFAPHSYEFRYSIKAKVTGSFPYNICYLEPLIMPTFTWNCCIKKIQFNINGKLTLKLYGSDALGYCGELEEILDKIEIGIPRVSFSRDYNLREVRLLLKNNVNLSDSGKLSIDSVKYMIEHASSSAITITLHPEAYERAIADAGVQAALANKTNVSLAKGE